MLSDPLPIVYEIGRFDIGKLDILRLSRVVMNPYRKNRMGGGEIFDPPLDTQ